MTQELVEPTIIANFAASQSNGMQTFRDLNLNKPLWNALDDLGYSTPTSIQRKAVPVIMSGRDVLGIAQTGTGKTFAFLLPLLRMWVFSKKRTPQIAIIVPTRELVAQTLENIEKLSPYLNLVAVGVYGGANIRTQAEQIAMGLDIIVATPGRFMDLALHGDLVLRDIKKLVIDEADELLELGFRPQLISILDLLPERRQNLLFSATWSEDVEEIIEEYFNNPERVEAAPAGTPLTQIKEEYLEVPNFNSKLIWVKHLFENNILKGKTMLFTESRKRADMLFEELEAIEHLKLGVIHSNKAQNQRFAAVNAFKHGDIQLLIATDLISRGIDIEGVETVLNLDVPDSPDKYIHRIGRTGRAEAEGRALTLVSTFEIKHWQAVCESTASTKHSLEWPLELPYSDELTEDEMPRIDMKIPEVKLPSRKEAGAAFHDKKAKNQKVNVRKNWKKIKMDKYGKPKTRGAKKK